MARVLERLPRVGDQLELDLFTGVPWSGRSPRALTKARSGLFLRREPGGHEVDPDPLQLSFWPVARKATRQKRRRQAAGAPPLLPLRGSKTSRRRFFEGE